MAQRKSRVQWGLNIIVLVILTVWTVAENGVTGGLLSIAKGVGILGGLLVLIAINDHIRRKSEEE